MERLSKKCTAILVGALTCLATGILLAPRVEMAPLDRPMSMTGTTAVQGVNATVRMIQSCAGGASVSCHPQKSRPQL